MYKLTKDLDNHTNGVLCLPNMACIPLDLANRDYLNFKREIAAGTAELQDADGQPMSVADANAYVATLP